MNTAPTQGATEGEKAEAKAGEAAQPPRPRWPFLADVALQTNNPKNHPAISTAYRLLLAVQITPLQVRHMVAAFPQGFHARDLAHGFRVLADELDRMSCKAEFDDEQERAANDRTAIPAPGAGHAAGALEVVQDRSRAATAGAQGEARSGDAPPATKGNGSATEH